MKDIQINYQFFVIILNIWYNMILKKLIKIIYFLFFKSQLSEGFLEIESKINQLKSKLIKNIDYELNCEQ